MQLGSGVSINPTHSVSSAAQFSHATLCAHVDDVSALWHVVVQPANTNGSFTHGSFFLSFDMDGTRVSLAPFRSNETVPARLPATDGDVPESAVPELRQDLDAPIDAIVATVLRWPAGPAVVSNLTIEFAAGCFDEECSASARQAGKSQVRSQTELVG